MSQRDFDQLRDAIEAAVDHARDRDGIDYGSRDVADDIVREHVAPLQVELESLRDELHSESRWREDMMHEVATLNPERAQAKAGRRYRRERDEAREARDLLLWLHAEAVWLLNQHEAADLSDHRLAAAEATLDHAEDRIADLLDDYGFARPEGLAEGLDMLATAFQVGAWLHAEAVWEGHQVGDRYVESEASRRDWAAEAMRLELELDAAHGAEGKALAEVANLERELAAVDDAEEKVECPGPVCAYSYVGEDRAQQLIDHYLRDHAARAVHPEADR